MKLALLVLPSLLAACLDNSPVAPPNPVAEPDGAPALGGAPPRVLDGFTYAMTVSWSSGVESCTTDELGLQQCEGPPPLAFEVTDVTCANCVLVSDPTGQTLVGNGDLAFSPIGAGPVGVTATVRWQDRAEQAVSEIPSDQIAGVEGACWIYEPDFLSAPCGQTRQASDIVMIAVGLYTAGGYSLDPGCEENDTCYPGEEPNVDSFTLDPAPSSWGAGFAVYDQLGTTTTVALAATLPSGASVATTISIPPID